MSPKQSPPEKGKSSAQNFAKYGGMGIQFFAACLLGVFLGKWLDAKLGFERPAFAVFLTIGFMAAAFYSIYKQLLRD